jgi:hypothetical protein
LGKRLNITLHTPTISITDEGKRFGRCRFF